MDWVAVVVLVALALVGCGAAVYRQRGGDLIGIDEEQSDRQLRILGMTREQKMDRVEFLLAEGKSERRKSEAEMDNLDKRLSALAKAKSHAKRARVA